jgi:BirA family transcriptional regulator, biotin operon repressor / biotin---[acetyl-CoA-carboxylase] ligase
MFTVLLCEPHLALHEHTVCLSVSLCQALEGLIPLRPAIKWPNDLLISDRKVCGVLAETTDAALGYVSIGLGLNVSWDGNRPCDVPGWATALDEHVVNVPPRLRILQETISCLDTWLSLVIQADQRARLRDEWLRRLWRRGQPVEVQLHDRRLRGVLSGTDEHGALMLITDAHELVKVLDGELVLPERPPRPA